MSTAYTEKVNRKVFRQFPELEGKNPSISSRPDGESLYTYKGKCDIAEWQSNVKGGSRSSE